MTSVRYGVCDAVDAGLPARLPVHLVAAEEGEVDAGVARRLDVGALRADQYSSWPTDRKTLVLEQLGAPRRSVSTPVM